MRGKTDPMKRDKKSAKAAPVAAAKPKSLPMAEVTNMLRHAAQKGFEAGMSAGMQRAARPAPGLPPPGRPTPAPQGRPTPPQVGPQAGQDPRAVLALLQRLRGGR
jgi:hypothetical protein